MLDELITSILLRSSLKLFQLTRDCVSNPCRPWWVMNLETELLHIDGDGFIIMKTFSSQKSFFIYIYPNGKYFLILRVRSDLGSVDTPHPSEELESCQHVLWVGKHRGVDKHSCRKHDSPRGRCSRHVEVSTGRDTLRGPMPQLCSLSSLSSQKQINKSNKFFFLT